MTENPWKYPPNAVLAWNEGYAAGDIAGFDRAIHRILDILEKEVKDYEP